MGTPLFAVDCVADAGIFGATLEITTGDVGVIGVPREPRLPVLPELFRRLPRVPFPPVDDPSVILEDPLLKDDRDDRGDPSKTGIFSMVGVIVTISIPLPFGTPVVTGGGGGGGAADLRGVEVSCMGLLTDGAITLVSLGFMLLDLLYEGPSEELPIPAPLAPTPPPPVNLSV